MVRFNYSNTSGFGTVFEESDTEVKNLAFGNIGNVAYCPEGMGAAGQNVLQAMYDGRFSLSDGPLLVQALSIDGDDNSNEVYMGADTMLDSTSINDISLNFQFQSTSEFGIVDFVNVFVGTQDGEESFELEGFSELADLKNVSLSEIMNMAGIELPINQYFYVRAELQTLATYGANSPRILEEENFHCFTNPIWLKLNSEPIITAINEALIESLHIYPNPTSDKLYIDF